MRRTLLALISVGCMAAASGAAAAEKPQTKPGGATLLMSPVAVPVVINGQLANFIYVSLRLNLGPRADADKLRAQEPFFRDALVRGAYRTPLQLATDPNLIDEPALRRLVLGEGVRIAGPGMVTGVQITRAQPQHFLPKPAVEKPRTRPAPPLA